MVKMHLQFKCFLCTWKFNELSWSLADSKAFLGTQVPGIDHAWIFISFFNCTIPSLDNASVGQQSTQNVQALSMKLNSFVLK